MKTTFTKLNSQELLNHRYRLQKPLGKGNCGEIWQVLDINTNEIKAMKCLIKQDSHRLELFTQEVAALMRLEHPGIPQVTWGEYFDEPLPCFVMEKITGVNLETWILRNKGRNLTPNLAIQWLKQMANILIYLHGEEYIHRDIKPANIMLTPEKKLLLIDFSLVKKIEPLEYQLETKGMGTPGYIPPEQNAGNSQLKSDIYALGYTLKRLLTNKYPTELKTHPQIWNNWLKKCPFWNVHQVSLLVDLLDKMTDENINHRPNAKEVLQQCLIIEQTSIQLWQKIMINLIIAMSVTTGILGIREQGWLEFWELKSYDLMMEKRNDGGIDDRLLIIGINDEDEKQYNLPISDSLLAEGIEKLQVYKPSVIGLNLLRDRPEKDGYNKFLSTLKTYPNIITSCYHGAINSDNNYDKPGTTSPSGITSSQIGFLDVFPDKPHNILRRQTLFRTLPNSVCNSELSLSFQIATQYLYQNYHIVPQDIPKSDNLLKLGSAIFQPLTHKSGGYRSMIDGDFQILLDYRSRKIAHVKSFRDVLDNKIDPQLIKDKIVIIGTTYEPMKNSFYTPLGDMTIVEIQAQMVSQIISNALGERPVLSIWKPELEIIYIFGCSLLGCLVIFCRHPWKLSLFIIIIITIYQFSLLMFTQGYWIPFIPSLLNFILTFCGLMIYNIYANINNKFQWSRAIAKPNNQHNKILQNHSNLT